MKSSLERQADLLLYKNGFDEKGRKRFKTPLERRMVKPKNKANRKFNRKINADEIVLNRNTELFKKRKGSDMSEGEKLVAECLIGLKISFEREKPMKGLINPATRYPLFFDFYLPDHRMVVEYDGKHHYENQNKKALKSQKDRDRAKDLFCQKKRIHLLRIPFYKSGRVKHLIVEKINQIIQLKQKK